jgi:hypothetical protein
MAIRELPRRAAPRQCEEANRRTSDATARYLDQIATVEILKTGETTNGQCLNLSYDWAAPGKKVDFCVKRLGFYISLALRIRVDDG